MFIAALLTTAKMWKQSACPKTGEWMKTYVCDCGVCVCVCVCVNISNAHMRYTHYLTYLCNYVKVIS